HADAGQGTAEIGAAAGGDHTRLLHLGNRRRRAHDDVGGLAISKPLLHPADRPEGEFDLIPGFAREPRSKVGDHVFYCTSGQNLQMNSGTAGDRSRRHRKILSRSHSPSTIPNAAMEPAYGVAAAAVKHTPGRAAIA